MCDGSFFTRQFMLFAIIAIHALQHLIEKCPQQGYFLANKALAVKQKWGNRPRRFWAIR
jgi:hypothetical protein